MNDNLSNRLQASLTPERKTLIAEAEKYCIENVYGKTEKPSEKTLGELVDELIKNWKEVKKKLKEHEACLTFL